MQKQHDDNQWADFQNKYEMLSPTNRVSLAIYIKSILMLKWLKRITIAAAFLYVIAILLVYVTPLLH